MELYWLSLDLWKVGVCACFFVFYFFSIWFLKVKHGPTDAHFFGDILMSVDSDLLCAFTGTTSPCSPPSRPQPSASSQLRAHLPPSSQLQLLPNPMKNSSLSCGPAHLVPSVPSLPGKNQLSPSAFTTPPHHSPAFLADTDASCPV